MKKLMHYTSNDRQFSLARLFVLTLGICIALSGVRFLPHQSQNILFGAAVCIAVALVVLLPVIGVIVFVVSTPSDATHETGGKRSNVKSCPQSPPLAVPV